MNMEMFIIIIVMLVVGVINNILPIHSKNGVLFGASVEEEDKHKGVYKELINKYRIVNLLIWIACIVLIVYGSRIGKEAVQAFGIILYLVLNGILIGFFNKSVRRNKENIKNEKKQVAVVSFEKIVISKGIKIYYCIMGIFFIGFSYVMAYLKYDSIPNRMPIHFNGQGIADGWIDKSVGNVIFAMSTIVIMVIVYIVSDVLIRKMPLKIDPKNKEDSYKANIKSKKLLNVIMMVTMIPMLIFATFTNLIILNIIDMKYMKYITFIPLITVVGVIGLTIAFIKVRNNYKVKNNDVTFKDDDDCWKFGLIYYNKNNPSVFVEKRMGIGLTVNAATKGGMAFYIVLLVLIVGSIITSVVK